MDCLKAQELVSDALDRDPVDAAGLALAKEHCRDCPQCAAFVHALVAVQRAPVPEPPEGLAERVIEAVRIEHARAERAAAAIATTKRATESARPSATGHDTPKTVSAVIERLMHPRHRRAVIAWSSAAAVALVAAGIGAVWGTRAILTDRAETQMIVLESGEQSTESAGMTFGNTSTPEAAEKDASSAARGMMDYSALSVSGLIAVNGAVYRSAGVDESVSKGTLTQRGSTRTALSSGGTVRDRAVLGTEDSSRVFIESDEGYMLAFDRVTMSFEGRTYVLQSGPLGEWGSAAVLPQGMTEPVTSEGSPTFESLSDQQDRSVYVLRGKDASAGIALPPGARADVAQGWSWWLPAGP